MRIQYFAALSGAAVVASVAVLATAAQAASPYFVTGGTTSLTLDNPALTGLGLTYSGSSGTVVPAAGFDYGFNILSPSSNPGAVGTSFTFDYAGAFVPTGGTIEHTGSLQYDVDPALALLSPFEIGDFSIGFDNGSFFVDGFFVTDNVSTGSRLFNLAVNPANASFDGSNLAVTNMSVLFSSEFNDILENASGNFDLNLTGTVIGSAQINATAQAVPTPALLPGLVTFVAAALADRRRRSA